MVGRPAAAAAVAVLAAAVVLPAAEAAGCSAAFSPEAWVAAHNKRRCMHAAPDVTWSAAMATSAQSWADEIKTNMKHSDSYGLSPPAGPAGENLAAASGKTMDAAKVVDMWYSEVDETTFSGGAYSDCTGVCGHFTAMVWKGVKEIGCGCYEEAGNKYMWVCRYKAGDTLSGDTPNMKGSYEKQVMEKSEEAACAASGGAETVVSAAGAAILSPLLLLAAMLLTWRP